MPAAAAAATGTAAAPAGINGSVAGVNSLSGVTCPTATKCVSAGLDSNLNGKTAISPPQRVRLRPGRAS